MYRGIWAFLFMLGLAMHAMPARAAPCEAEWRAFEIERDRGGGSWMTFLNEGMTYDNNVKAMRSLVYGDSWNMVMGDSEVKPADPATAFRKAASVIAGRLANQQRPDARASGAVSICLANALADEAARQQQPPATRSTKQETQTTPSPKRQLAMNAPPKPEEDADAPREGESGKPNPKQLYKGKPAVAEIANHCMGLRTDPTNFGGFTNSCDFEVNAVWCAYHPLKGAWSEIFDCESPKGTHGGLTGIGAHGQEAEHTDNAEYIYWFACRKPSFPKVEYTSGQGFYGHCQ